MDDPGGDGGVVGSVPEPASELRFGGRLPHEIEVRSRATWEQLETFQGLYPGSQGQRVKGFYLEAKERL